MLALCSGTMDFPGNIATDTLAMHAHAEDKTADECLK